MAPQRLAAGKVACATLVGAAMEIASPKTEVTHPDYGLSCEEALDIPARELIDGAIQAGWDPRTVYKALAEVARNQALAYEEDPDPEDDPA